MKVLITGGLGINGAWVTRALVARGLRPVVLEVRDDFSLAGKALRDQVDLELCDITDLPALSAVLAQHRPDCIIHMAAAIGGFHSDLHKTFAINAMGTVNVLEAASRAGTRRVVFASSRAAYGSIRGASSHPTYTPIREDDPAWPDNAYDVGKLASEVMGRNYAATFGIEFVALRFAAIYGPGKLHTHGEFGVLSRMIEQSLAGQPVTIAHGGEQRDDVIYVEDVAEGIVLATLHHGKPRHHLYNISRNVGTTLHDFAAAVQAVIPCARIEIGPGLDYLGVGSNYFGVMDNTRAREDLGFEPKFDLQRGIAAYVSRLKERSA